MPCTEHLLIIEDDSSLRRVMQIQLSREGYSINTASSSEGALAMLESSAPQLVIADLNLPGASGLELLRKIRARSPETPVIIITAFGTVQSAVEAMKGGAYDYIIKPIHPEELKAIIRRALDHSRLVEEVQILRSSLDRKYGFEHIIGSSPTFLRVLEVAERVAVTDATVLIQGETGTGKELVARAVHLKSQRRDRPFLTINCGAIPRELLESELFGYVKGSFTGAESHKKGKVELANGGSVFLDEIGEMPLELQVKILRLLQEKEIEKVGETAPIKVDVRIIASTNRDLLAMVKEGTFREDLYYRLLVVPLYIPSLRDRLEDIPELLEHFFEKFKLKHHRPELVMAPGILPYFSNYRWPGNVRQLENVVERIVLLCRGTEITADDLPDFLQLEPSSTATQTLVELPDDGLSLEALERQLFLRVLRKFGGNKTRAARFLDLSRRTFSYRLEKFGIESEREVTVPMRAKRKMHGGGFQA